RVDRLRRDRCRGNRFGRGSGSESGARRRNGRELYGAARAADVSGSAQIDWRVARTNTLLIFINQIREKIGVVFGNPETTTGGRALKFYSSVRIEVRRMGALKDGEVVVGNR